MLWKVLARRKGKTSRSSAVPKKKVKIRTKTPSIAEVKEKEDTEELWESGKNK